MQLLRRALGKKLFNTLNCLKWSDTNFCRTQCHTLAGWAQEELSNHNEQTSLAGENQTALRAQKISKLERKVCSYSYRSFAKDSDGRMALHNHRALEGLAQLSEVQTGIHLLEWFLWVRTTNAAFLGWWWKHCRTHMEWWFHCTDDTQLNSECCQCENTCYMMRAQVLERANLTSVKPLTG